MCIVKSICSCLKIGSDAKIVSLSVPLALLLLLPGAAQSALVTYCCDQAAEDAYLAAIDSLAFADRVPESFETGAWVDAQTVPQSSVSNQGITWERPGAFLSTSDNGGDAHDGGYVMFTWDNSSGLPLHAFPDGYTLTANGFPLYAVGGWFTGNQAKLGFIVDGDPTRVNFTGEEARVDAWKFLGFIENDPTQGFGSVQIVETDEIVGDEMKIFFSDDFTLGAAAVPLPAALPLFATGLMAMVGLLGRRSKRSMLEAYGK